MSNEIAIIKAIAEHLGLSPEDVDRGATLRDDLNLSPIELNDLLSALAKQFDITFQSEDVENLNRVEDLIVLVEDNLID
ncbi:hypothetical protein A3B45_01985 [Candidatus Daviesbacteria bacterium RIFCSPLOWO2_01_FULL_39_12]|uniref:Carrier domain-containing protein n=1 Tax=Candidatus Daviesbacteria bacterium RIFCSPLOWO2_01_FULL_39_12 TaxID=1797785 RepID=A0A1F5KMW5_9BACT|nr:MAG: hypothetical protein A3D79_03150 [Candidatus Daviesbacteria bacterium RIFCSPHIGHO2_02_FULL_39_8]OGE41971.1 MAG: hypothetical protein A3B45_01985 [Candidatus Daviesbacteria bacterium RIFCSPLOWO2_01_FULL_39_12]